VLAHAICVFDIVGFGEIGKGKGEEKERDMKAREKTPHFPIN